MTKLKNILMNLPWLNHLTLFIVAFVIPVTLWATVLQHYTLPAPAVSAILLIGYVYGVFSAYVMRQFLHVVLKDKWELEPVKWASSVPPFTQAVLLTVAVPAVIVYTALALVGLVITLVCVRVETEHKVWTRLGRWLMSKPFSRPKVLQRVRPLHCVTTAVALAAALAVEQSRTVTMTGLIVITGLLMFAFLTWASVSAFGKIDARKKRESSTQMHSTRSAQPAQNKA